MPSGRRALVASLGLLDYLPACHRAVVSSLGEMRGLASAAEAVLGSLRNFEKNGVPDGAGAASNADGFDLGRMHLLLKGLHNPEHKLKVVHVAGSKGKGSVSAMLSSILFESGYRVGTYSSPHIISLTERIAVDCQRISEAALDSLANRSQAALEAANAQAGGKLSHFEALTGLALTHFAEQKVDAAVVEVGLGGSRDATNVFDSNSLQLAVITAISLEHQKALGPNIQDIAAAKAGISKPGRPVIIGQQPSEAALQCLTKVAQDVGAPTIQAAEVLSVEVDGINRDEAGVSQGFHISPRNATSKLLQTTLDVTCKLVGSHQAENAATAVAAALELHKQGWSKISPESIQQGLQDAVLPGRFQVRKLGPEKPWLVLDGAHTPESAQALCSTLAAAFPGEPISLVIAMAADKDHPGVLAELRKARPMVVVFTAVPIAGASDRSAPPGMLVAHWQASSFSEDRPLRCRELIKANMATAVDACERELFSAPGDGVICVTGSLHSVGAASCM